MTRKTIAKNTLRLRNAAFVFAAALLWAFVFNGCKGGLPAQKAAKQDISALIDSAYKAVGGNTQAPDRFGNVLTDISASALADAGYEPGDFVHITAGAFDGAIPFVEAYTDVPRGSELIRISGGQVQIAISYGNFAEKHAAADSSPVTIQMAKKDGYKADMEIMRLKKLDNRSDYASDEIFANFRAVSFGSIPPDFLYRSCHPALGDSRAPYAAKLAEQAGIATVINLADTVPEVTAMAANVPWYSAKIREGGVAGLAMGVDFASPDFRAKLRDGIRFMLQHDGPFLIHCNEGKDRTGYVAALFEGLAGASAEQIIADYMVTYENYFGFTREEPRYAIVSRVMADILAEMNGGKPVIGRNAQKAAENCLVTQIGLTKAEASALKKKLSGK
ncbi:MAG: hypothetical protein Pg6C_07530 [Treponemataceae bacterium]|nr:MAG: hypothetical protein Pg6C_07530 [Treponemataceae bacterium]